MDGGKKVKADGGRHWIEGGMVGMWGVSGHCDGCERAGGREDT